MTITKPRNTAKELPHLAEVLAFGTGLIEAQEAQGAREAAASESLPTPRQPEREQYEALGFVFGEPFADDRLFCPVTLPAGWTKRRTSHSMHTDIVDAAGNVRGSFFYKAAFYDRDAILYPARSRYRIREHFDDGPRPDDSYDRYKVVHYEVIDTANADAVLHDVKRTVDVTPPTQGGDHAAFWNAQQQVKDAVFDECKSWLAERFPDWTNPAAYWPTT